MGIEKLWSELEKCGLLDEDSDKFEVGNTVLNFARDFYKISERNRDEVLRKIYYIFGTGEPKVTSEGWEEITDNLWQNKNNPELFSTDGGKTYYSCNDSERTIHTTLED